MADNVAMLMADAPQEKVQVRISTRDQSIALPEDPGTTVVSSSWKRLQLSSLVNSLQQNERPVPYEFLINGRILRTTLDEFLTKNGISTETVLSVEYIRALSPPTHVASFEHDDWVSSVDIISSTSPASTWRTKPTISQGQARILSGSYDGLLRLWDTTNASEPLAISKLPLSSRVTSIKSVKFLSPIRLVSAGLDAVLRVWKYDPDHLTIEPTLELYGHKWAVESLAVHSPSSHILSASSDHTLGLWSTSTDLAPAAPESLISKSIKRQKVFASQQQGESPEQRGPLSLLCAHTAPVSSVIFSPADPTAAYSTSHDHTLRTWDLATSTPVSLRTTNSSLLSLTTLPTLSLLAAGSSARHITLIDPRESTATIAAATLRGHTNSVVDLAADPENEHRLVSASHDGTCRVWDVRNVKTAGSDVRSVQVGESVYTIDRESMKQRSKRAVAGDGVKVFGICWDREVGIVSGGEDKKVQINAVLKP
ncbi:putative microtubule associated protein [Pseudovirgaria hyperparasitica]|uniref:Ribosome biogenesis protein YTM1 n=1 Tax=Pseudovirgaria hyperparasitica TaxID=470096 RepID=A0A6A6VU05_9PEZI|nr:putative microtubule associated protein [Pseudovirgaria hyperparasitica]KAF2753090.1 putative microtubule associated protein [Pseudovirgaria hyperparasitica]